MKRPTTSQKLKSLRFVKNIKIEVSPEDEQKFLKLWTEQMSNSSPMLLLESPQYCHNCGRRIVDLNKTLRSLRWKNSKS